LYGPPGCGKSFFLKSTANEFRLAHELISCQRLKDEIREGIKTQMFFKKLFSRARQSAPSMIILDNIEEITSRDSLRDQKVRKAVYQLLRELDHIKTGDRLLITATSDYPHMIEPLLFKAKRFDKLIFVPMPNFESRRDLFEMYLSDYPVERDINSKSLGRISDGYSGEDIRHVVDLAAHHARQRRARISMHHLEEAIRRVQPSLTPEILDPIKKFFMNYKRGTLWRGEGIDSNRSGRAQVDEDVEDVEDDETVEFEILDDEAEEDSGAVEWTEGSDDEDEEDDEETDFELSWDDADADEDEDEDEDEEVEDWD
jgi:hypothetical protein